MKLRFFGLLVVIGGLASTVGASYELLMGIDYGQQVVRRMDGITGAQLGSFGKGLLNNAISMCINQSNSEAYVLDRTGGNKRIYVFNYNTGEYLRDFGVSGYAFGHVSMASNGDLLVGTTDDTATSTLGRYSSVGVPITTYLPFAGQLTSGLVEGSDGYVYGVDHKYGYLLRYAPSGGSYLAYLSTGAVVSYRGQFVVQGTTGMSIGYSTLKVTTVNLSGSFSVGATTDLSSALPYTLSGAAFGHGNIAYFSGSSTTGGKIIRFNRATNTILSTVATDASWGEIAALSCVVAPEPESFAPLAAGLVGITVLRRRRERTA